MSLSEDIFGGEYQIEDYWHRLWYDAVLSLMEGPLP